MIYLKRRGGSFSANSLYENLSMLNDVLITNFYLCLEIDNHSGPVFWTFLEFKTESNLCSRPNFIMSNQAIRADVFLSEVLIKNRGDAAIVPCN